MKVVPDQLVRRIEPDFESIPPAVMAHAVDTFGDPAQSAGLAHNTQSRR